MGAVYMKPCGYWPYFLNLNSGGWYACLIFNISTGKLFKRLYMFAPRLKSITPYRLFLFCRKLVAWRAEKGWQAGIHTRFFF